MSGDSLWSLKGIRFKETIISNAIAHYTEVFFLLLPSQDGRTALEEVTSRINDIRGDAAPLKDLRWLKPVWEEPQVHLEFVIGACVQSPGSSRDTLSPNSSLTDSPVPLKVCGPLTVFSFVVPAKYEKVSYAEQKANLKSAVEDNPDFQDGLLLSTREKGVLFPVVHVSENGEVLSNKLQNGALGEFALNDNVIVQQAVYQEVRKIVPETELPQVAPFPQLQEKIGYILLGFKSLDKNFSQVMLDTWKDWTGARYIYMYLPDDLGLRRISFYHRQHPDDLNLFKYLVLVECHGITSREKLVQLLDFAQRMRLERLTGYISVYAGEKSSFSASPTSPFEIPQLDDYVSTNRKNVDIVEDLFPNDSPLQRNSRM